MMKVLGYKNENEVMVFEYLEWISTGRAVGYWQKVDSNYIAVEFDNDNDDGRPNYADSFECVLLGRDVLDSIYQGYFHCENIQNDKLVKWAKKEFLRGFLEGGYKQDSNENSKE